MSKNSDQRINPDGQEVLGPMSGRLVRFVDDLGFWSIAHNRVIDRVVAYVAIYRGQEVD